MTKTFEVNAAADTHSAIASFLVAEVYKFAFANGKFMIEVRDEEEALDRFDSFLVFFQATSIDMNPKPKEEPKS